MADHTASAHAARFAIMVNADLAMAQLGIPQSHISAATRSAAAAYWTHWDLEGEIPMPSKDLNQADLERLTSVVSPHALDWIQGPSP